jgi:hypothetical protein
MRPFLIGHNLPSRQRRPLAAKVGARYIVPSSIEDRTHKQRSRFLGTIDEYFRFCSSVSISKKQILAGTASFTED